MRLPQRLTDWVAAFVLAAFSVTVGLGVGLVVGAPRGCCSEPSRVGSSV